MKNVKREKQATKKIRDVQTSAVINIYEFEIKQNQYNMFVAQFKRVIQNNI